jgi:hemerythrin-like metal-binding protein
MQAVITLTARPTRDGRRAAAPTDLVTPQNHAVRDWLVCTLSVNSRTAMNALAWTEDLRLNQPQMDKTHEEFVKLLALTRASIDDGDRGKALATFQTLIDHTVQHFGQEERWMRAIGFDPDNLHAQQHGDVLRAMRAAMRLASEDGRWEPIGIAISELGQWFPLHARMMDADLVLCMAKVGFDPMKGEFTQRRAEPAAAR